MADLFNVTLHARDPRRLGRFWSEVLGYTIAQDTGPLVRLRGPAARGAPDLLILQAEVLGPPGGRLHLDLAADDIDREVDRLVGLGAALVDGSSAAGPRRRGANGIAWVVLTDPEGNDLCVGSRP